MTKEKIKKLIEKCKMSLEMFVEAGNEYDFDSYNILVSVIDDDWEYGYGDYTFRYESTDEFFERAEKDILNYDDFEEARSVAVDIVYFDKDCPEDEERIEYEEIY
jgi:hypothetical protein